MSISTSSIARQAHAAVWCEINAGRLARACEFDCVDCGKPARDYDHYLGYEREHWLDVEPVCHRCNLFRSPAFRATMFTAEKQPAHPNGATPEAISAGLQKARARGVRIGRPVGAKDSKPRSRDNYIKRWAEHR